jgi:hypothetical protein
VIENDEAEEIREAIREAMRAYGARVPRKKKALDDGPHIGEPKPDGEAS